MAHLGVLVVTLRLDNQLNGELQSALSNLGRGGGGKKGKILDIGQKGFVNDLKEASSASRTFEGTWKQVDAAMSVTQKNMIKAGAANMEFSRSFSVGADGVVRGSLSMRDGVNQSIGSMTKNLLSLSSFVGKIVHYITFSIGVQMVMVIKQSFGELIDTVIKFQAAVINTTTVSGYFGAAFDNAAEKVRNLAVVLSQKTIFSILDTADALYTLAQAGYDVTTITEDQLLPILEYAAAHNIKLEDAFLDVMSAAKAFGMNLDDTREIVDIFTSAVITSFASAQDLS